MAWLVAVASHSVPLGVWGMTSVLGFQSRDGPALDDSSVGQPGLLPDGGRGDGALVVGKGRRCGREDRWRLPRAAISAVLMLVVFTVTAPWSGRSRTRAAVTQLETSGRARSYCRAGAD